MKTPDFLTKSEVLVAHTGVIGLYGGSHGVRDDGLLDAALAQAEATFDGVYLHQDIYEMAAAYLYHLVRNHAFVDGNKRIAVFTASAFLELNDVPIDETVDIPSATTGRTKLEDLVLNTVDGRMTKADIARFFRANSICDALLSR